MEKVRQFKIGPAVLLVLLALLTILVVIRKDHTAEEAEDDAVRACFPQSVAFPPPPPRTLAVCPCSGASLVSGRRRRARLPSRWPPSAAQTERAVFPHSAFTKARYKRRRIEGISAIKRTRPNSP
jgi:hypothetical protein